MQNEKQPGVFRNDPGEIARRIFRETCVPALVAMQECLLSDTFLWFVAQIEQKNGQVTPAELHALIAQGMARYEASLARVTNATSFDGLLGASHARLLANRAIERGASRMPRASEGEAE